jgi:hypothetical protein
MYTVNPRRDPVRAKQRDMSRSVLPSKGRIEAAKDLASVRRSVRRVGALRMARLVGLNPVQLLDELDAMDFNQLERRQTRDVGFVVQDRRYADKVAPLMRWAVASTKNVRPEDRLSKLARSLPKNLIGAHAMLHLEIVEELNPIWPRPRWSFHRTVPDLGEGERLRSGLHVVLESGLHRDFNRLLAAHADGARICRPLEGSQDIEAFIDELDRSQLHAVARLLHDAGLGSPTRDSSRP